MIHHTVDVHSPDRGIERADQPLFPAPSGHTKNINLRQKTQCFVCETGQFFVRRRKESRAGLHCLPQSGGINDRLPAAVFQIMHHHSDLVPSEPGDKTRFSALQHTGDKIRPLLSLIDIMLGKGHFHRTVLRTADPGIESAQSGGKQVPNSLFQCGQHDSSVRFRISPVEFVFRTYAATSGPNVHSSDFR